MTIEEALTSIAESLQVLAKNSELARAQYEEAERTLCAAPDAPTPEPEKPKRSKKTNAAEPTPEPEPEPEPTPEWTLDSLRETFSARIIQKGKQADARKFFSDHGSNAGLTGLDPKHYPAYAAFCEEVLG